MSLLEKLQQLLDSNATAEEIQSSLAEYMVPKNVFNDTNNKKKELELKTLQLEADMKVKDTELETIKTANMTELELLNHKLAKHEETIKANSIEKNRLREGAKFAEAGYTKEEYEPLLQSIVTDDEAHSAKVVDSFLGLAKTKIEGAKQEQMNSLLDNGTKLPNGDPVKPNLDDVDSIANSFNDDLE